jgi:hypothetical protein
MGASFEDITAASAASVRDTEQMVAHTADWEMGIEVGTDTVAHLLDTYLYVPVWDCCTT